MKKSLLVFLVIMAVLAGTFANGQNDGAKSDSQGPAELTVFSWGPRDVAEGDQIVPVINEKFNMNLISERVLAKEFNNILQTRIAADDVPDVFRLNNNNIYNTLYVDGMLINWDEKTKEYGLSNIGNYTNQDGIDDFREKDGLFRLPSRKGPAKGCLMVRQDWLDELGLEKPTDYDELREMLIAFKEADLDGQGATGITGFQTHFWEHVIIGWTGINGWGLVDGRWTYHRTMAEYKEALTYLHELYQEGLIDPETFILDESQAKAKLVSGKAGALFIMNDRYPKLNAAMADKGGSGDEIGIIMPLEGPAGTFRPEIPGFSGYVMIFNTKPEETVELGCRVYDYLHGDEGKNLLTHGVEGIHYTVEKGMKVYNENHKRDIIPGLGHLLNMTVDYSSMNDLFTGIERENYLASLEYGVFDPAANLATEKAADIRTAFEEFEEEWIVGFITGERDLDAQWDEFQQLYKSNGIDEYTAEVTAYMNRF